jgi:hypothetical protein
LKSRASLINPRKARITDMSDAAEFGRNMIAVLVADGGHDASETGDGRCVESGSEDGL